MKAIRTSLMVAAAFVGLSGAAHADVKAGVDAWGLGDYERAAREWQAPADAGDPDAQFNLGQAYKLGRGVPRDLLRAETLYARAAAKGHLQAADNYGLLLFQRGEKAKAMPYVRAAAERGDARAQYIYGLAMFNADGVPKDWIRAYAYASMAQQAGLPQATGALAQMDGHISMEDRQKAVVLAGKLAAETEATRARQLAAMDLGDMPGSTAVSDGGAGTPPARPAPSRPAPARPSNQGTTVATVERAATDAARAAGSVRAPEKPAASRPRQPATATIASGSWRLQLGAFGVPGNAEALWNRVKARPELAGHARLLVPSGKLTRLLATGFASKGAAESACARLKSAGFACLATPN